MVCTVMVGEFEVLDWGIGLNTKLKDSDGGEALTSGHCTASISLAAQRDAIDTSFVDDRPTVSLR